MEVRARVEVNSINCSISYMLQYSPEPDVGGFLIRGGFSYMLQARISGL